MKSTAKLSLLLLLGVAHQSLEAKPASKDSEMTSSKAKKKKVVTDTDVEKEKKRVIYHAITQKYGYPLFSLRWNSIPAVKNVTEAEVNKAQVEYERSQKSVQELMTKRNDYLMHKYPVYAELQRLQESVQKYWDAHSEELIDIENDKIYQEEIVAAERKASPYFWEYWTLENQYRSEHPEFYGPHSKPYQNEKENVAEEIKESAHEAQVINIAPGHAKKLPSLHSGNGTLDLERVINYSLSLPDGKAVEESSAVLRIKTITDKKRLAMPGASASTYEYTVSVPRHAKPATIYILEHHVNGEISVYATLRITKGEDSVPAAQKKAPKAKADKPVKPKKSKKESATTTTESAAPHKKHVPGKKDDVPAKKNVKKKKKTDMKNSQ
jgi:hypothetical protein